MERLLCSCVSRLITTSTAFLAYPSGHTLGTIIQFGFAIFLAFRLGLNRRVLIITVALLVLPIVFVGPARVLVRVHWSPDILGAYLLGAASLIVLVLLFKIGEQWLAGRGLLEYRAQTELAP